jgi:restriction endonuclease S subunit
MNNFILSDEVNSEKCFILNRAEIEKRLDPFYYIPSIKKLEEEVKKKGSLPLRAFVENISSGATPKTAEKEKYYSDEENGIPFLRVQNLSPTGFLKLENCKYINEETHNNYLKRSQVEGGNLLVKITGVGRMAVASVAPDGFIGNTNQHMVVIRTKDKETSRILASYLNTDIGEMLASRRATGGTRPALDYPALLSIPIIFDNKILEIYKSAIESKKEKEKQAKELLDSIDDYLLDELGITLPEIDNSLEKRIFEVNLSDVSGGRFDPFYYKYCKNIMQSFKYEELDVIELAYIQKGQSITSKEVVKGNFPVIAGGQTSPYSHNQYNYDNNVITISASGAYSGYVWYHNYPIFASDCNVLQSKNEKKLKTLFLFEVLKLKQQELYNLQQGSGQPHVYADDIKRIKIPLPSLEKQNEIAEYIQGIRDKAKELRNEAVQGLENAKNKVEQMILGE